MKRMTFFLALALLSATAVASSRADEPTTSYDFSTEELSSAWKSPSGNDLGGAWKVVDGLLQADTGERKHAVAILREDGIECSAIKFRFMPVAPVTEKTNFQIGFNSEARTVFNIRFEEGKVNLTMCKNKKFEKDPTHPHWKTITLDSKELTLVPGQWIDVSYRIEGEHVMVACGELALEGTHPSLASEKKQSYRIVATQGVVRMDDVRIGG
jgi:hypothetical protein